MGAHCILYELEEGREKEREGWKQLNHGLAWTLLNTCHLYHDRDNYAHMTKRHWRWFFDYWQERILDEGKKYGLKKDCTVRSYCLLRIQYRDENKRPSSSGTYYYITLNVSR